MYCDDVFDGSDFNPKEMCCACGGGSKDSDDGDDKDDEDDKEDEEDKDDEDDKDDDDISPIPDPDDDDEKKVSSLEVKLLDAIRNSESEQDFMIELNIV